MSNMDGWHSSDVLRKHQGLLNQVKRLEAREDFPNLGGQVEEYLGVLQDLEQARVQSRECLPEWKERFNKTTETWQERKDGIAALENDYRQQQQVRSQELEQRLRMRAIREARMKRLYTLLRWVPLIVPLVLFAAFNMDKLSYSIFSFLWKAGSEGLFMAAIWGIAAAIVFNRLPVSMSQVKRALIGVGSTALVAFNMWNLFGWLAFAVLVLVKFAVKPQGWTPSEDVKKGDTDE